MVFGEYPRFDGLQDGGETHPYRSRRVDRQIRDVHVWRNRRAGDVRGRDVRTCPVGASALYAMNVAIRRANVKDVGVRWMNRDRDNVGAQWIRDRRKTTGVILAP